MHICQMSFTRGLHGTLLFDPLQTASEPFLFMEKDDIDSRLQHMKWVKKYFPDTVLMSGVGE